MRRQMTNNDAVDRCRLAGAVSNIIHHSASTGEPRFALESYRIVDAGRLPMQHLSNNSYYAIVNLVLHEGRSMCDVAGAAGLKLDATIKLRTTWRTCKRLYIGTDIPASKQRLCQPLSWIR